MKIQQRTSTTATKKSKKSAKANTSFNAMFDQQSTTVQDTPIIDQPKQQHKQELKKENKHLNNILDELEDITLNLEAGSEDHSRAQLAINSLRDALHDMPETFPLTEKDREEAKALLAVEAKRIEELRKYEG